MQSSRAHWSHVLAAGVLALACCLPATAAPSEQETLATGTWYGEFSPGPGQPLQRFLTTRLADGTFMLVARLYENGRAKSELRNAGLWGISNGLYFTVTTEVDGKRLDPRNAEMANPYLIRSLAAGTFEYQHIASGRLFRVKLVDPAITRLPD